MLYNQNIYQKYNHILGYSKYPMQPELKDIKVEHKRIQIQKLDRKDQIKGSQVPLQHLVGHLDKPNQQQMFGYYNKMKPQKPQLSFEQKLYCYKDTASNKQRIMSGYNSFFNAFFCPYNQHGDILLVPDDIWLMISLYLSKYIDKNAQKLRNQFVNHEGQKELTIKQYASSLEQSLKMEKEWDFFFSQIIKQIQKNTKPGVVESLSCNFTTTNQTYKLISTSIIMSSFKKYFSYGRAICMCGINNVYFAGTREDWLKVQEKLNNLNKYDVNGELKKYVTHVGAILKKFIETFDGKPDVNWWNTIMTSEKRRVGSGGDTETYIQGWILHFFGLYTKTQIESIPQTLVNVPIKLVNQFTGIQKKLQLIADWVSVSKINEETYKPDIGMCIIEKERKQIQPNS